MSPRDVSVDAIADAGKRAIEALAADRRGMTRMQRKCDERVPLIDVGHALAVDAVRARGAARELSGRRYFRAGPCVPGRTAPARHDLRATVWYDDRRLVFTWSPAGLLALPLVLAPENDSATATLALAKGGAPCES